MALKHIDEDIGMVHEDPLHVVLRGEMCVGGGELNEIAKRGHITVLHTRKRFPVKILDAIFL